MLETVLLSVENFLPLSDKNEHQIPSNKPLYVNAINPNPIGIANKPINLKQAKIVEGVPRIRWTEAEVQQMNVNQNLQYATIGKFSYGWPNLEVLRKMIPSQCGIKGEFLIGLLRHRHVLIRLSLMEDFINMISKGAYYITCKEGYSYLMRTLIYDLSFKVEEETTKSMAWISFPHLLPTFYEKEALFSLASSVRIPLQLDQATINKTRPLCQSQNYGRPACNPKYCEECKIQGHNRKDCWVLNPGAEGREGTARPGESFESND